MAIKNFQCTRHSLASNAYLGPTMAGPVKNFRNIISQMAGKCNFEFGFCN